MKLFFPSRKEANGFKRSTLHGAASYTQLAYAVREISPSLLIDDDSEEHDNFFVDIDATKNQPIKKEEELFVIECVRYIPKPKTKGVAAY